MTTNSILSSTINATGVIAGAGVINASGTAGGYYINNSASNWMDASITSDIKNSTLHVKGDATFEGDITIGGVSLGKTLEKITQRLAMLTPNPELESRWEELKLLADRYRELEAEILEKEKILEILKR
jgi:hypothetical protein